MSSPNYVLCRIYKKSEVNHKIHKHQKSLSQGQKEKVGLDYKSQLELLPMDLPASVPVWLLTTYLIGKKEVG